MELGSRVVEGWGLQVGRVAGYHGKLCGYFIFIEFALRLLCALLVIVVMNTRHATFFSTYVGSQKGTC